MKIIDGKAVAEKVINECKDEIAELKKKGGYSWLGSGFDR